MIGWGIGCVFVGVGGGGGGGGGGAVRYLYRHVNNHELLHVVCGPTSQLKLF